MLETHVHNDDMGGGLALARRTGPDVAVGTWMVVRPWNVSATVRSDSFVTSRAGVPD
jgi:hypothetical protein